MNSNNVIAQVEAFVKERLANDSSGHDWWHVERIRNTARTIHASEGGDWFVIELAILLHDVGDYKVVGGDEDDYSIAENYMRELHIAEDIVEHVMNIIKFMSYSKSLEHKQENPSIEFKIVQDVDRIDAIGAIGIARAFAFGGSKSRLLYDPTYALEAASTTKDYRAAHGSTFHHFEEKLLHIKDLLNTDAARTIAIRRDNFMREFLEQFLNEWNGKS